MNDLLDLADRCERAEGPDRALDGLAHILANPDKPWIVGHEPGRFPQKAIYGTLSDFAEWAAESCDAPESNERCDPADAIGAPAYTASIDAAMTLVPEGWDGGLYLASPGLRPNVQLETEQMRSAGTLDRFQPIEGSGATLALALCAASLRARASQEQPA